MQDLDIIKDRLAEEKRARKQADSQLVEYADALEETRKGLVEMASIVAGVPYPVILFNSRGIISLANPAAIRYWGMGVLPGASLFEAFTFVNDLDIKALIESDQVLELLGRKQGEYFRFTFKGDSKQELCQLYGLDITQYEKEKLEVQQASKDSEELLTSLSSVLIGVDQVGRVMLWNKTAEALFGIKELEALGKPLATCGIDWDVAKVEQLFKACQENATFYESQLPYGKPDGEQGLLEIVFTPVAQKINRRAGVFLLARDVTHFGDPEAVASDWDDMGEIIDMVSTLAREMSGPVQSIAENLRYLDTAIEGVREVLEANIRLLEGNQDDASFEKHMQELEELIRSTRVDRIVSELPDTLGDTITMIGKVARLVKGAEGATFEPTP